MGKPLTILRIALCKKVSSNYGGEIFASSKPDHGSAFHIFFGNLKLLFLGINHSHFIVIY